LTGVRAPLKTDWDGSRFGVREGQVSSTRARRLAGGPAFEPESPPDRGCLGHRQVRHPIRRPAADGQDLPNRRRVVVGSRTRRMASGLSAWMEKSTMSVSPPPNAQELAHQLPEALNIIRHTGSWTATVDRDIGRPVVAQPAVSLAQVLANLWLDLHWRRMTKGAAGRLSWKMRTFKHKQQISSKQTKISKVPVIDVPCCAAP
jgi:hypothetical protein